MGEEAEKAANWDAVEEFRKLKRHRETIADAMGKLGKALGDFAYFLQHREGCTFAARPGEIVVGKDRGQVARVDPEHLDWGLASRLIADYVATTERIAELEPRFRDLS